MINVPCISKQLARLHDPVLGLHLEIYLAVLERAVEDNGCLQFFTWQRRNTNVVITSFFKSQVSDPLPSASLLIQPNKQIILYNIYWLLSLLVDAEKIDECRSASA